MRADYWLAALVGIANASAVLPRGDKYGAYDPKPQKYDADEKYDAVYRRGGYDPYDPKPAKSDYTPKPKPKPKPTPKPKYKAEDSDEKSYDPVYRRGGYGADPSDSYAAESSSDSDDCEEDDSYKPKPAPPAPHYKPKHQSSDSYDPVYRRGNGYGGSSHDLPNPYAADSASDSSDCESSSDEYPSAPSYGANDYEEDDYDVYRRMNMGDYKPKPKPKPTPKPKYDTGKKDEDDYDVYRRMNMGDYKPKPKPTPKPAPKPKYKSEESYGNYKRAEMAAEMAAGSPPKKDYDPTPTGYAPAKPTGYSADSDSDDYSSSASSGHKSGGHSSSHKHSSDSYQSNDDSSDSYPSNHDSSDSYSTNDDSSDSYPTHDDSSSYPSNDYESNDYPSNDWESNSYPSNDYESNDYPSNDYESNDYPWSNYESNSYPWGDSSDTEDEYPSTGYSTGYPTGKTHYKRQHPTAHHHPNPPTSLASWRPKTEHPEFFSLRIDATCADPTATPPDPGCAFLNMAIRLENGILIATPYNKWWDPVLPIFFVDDDTQMYTVSRIPLQIYVNTVTGAVQYSDVGQTPNNAITWSFYKSGTNPLGVVNPSPSHVSWPSTQGNTLDGDSPFELCALGGTGQYQLFVNSENGGTGPGSGITPDAASCQPVSLASINANPYQRGAQLPWTAVTTTAGTQ